MFCMDRYPFRRSCLSCYLNQIPACCFPKNPGHYRTVNTARWIARFLSNVLTRDQASAWELFDCFNARLHVLGFDLLGPLERVCDP
jgi:hypothetical protein